MDEPFSALDAMTRDDMNRELLRIWEEERKTVFFVTHSIREAVFLSDRVFVMSPRPAVIRRVVDIELPRPRDLDIQESPEFNRYVSEIRQAIERQTWKGLPTTAAPAATAPRAPWGMTT